MTQSSGEPHIVEPPNAEKLCAASLKMRKDIDTAHKALEACKRSSHLWVDTVAAEAVEVYRFRWNNERDAAIGYRLRAEKAEAALRAFLTIDFSPTFDAKGVGAERKKAAVDSIRYVDHKEACERALNNSSSTRTTKGKS